MPLLGIWEDTMNKMEKALYELSEMDDLAAQRSPVHGLCPMAKLLSTIAYIIVAVSFHKYDLSGLVPMVLWPVFLFQLSGIPVRITVGKRAGEGMVEYELRSEAEREDLSAGEAVDKVIALVNESR